MQDIIYFELNNWMPGEHYPEEEPFISWIGNERDMKLLDEEWAVENRLCITAENIDMSLNFRIAATKEWVEKNCPKLLTQYKKFLRHPDKDGKVYGQFGNIFPQYKKKNIGVKRIDEE